MSREADAAFVPNIALDLGQLPAREARWSDLVRFAGSFDAYVLKPSPALLEAMLDRALATWRGENRLPESLTGLRAALAAYQRRDYWTGGYGGQPPDLDFAHALVEAIRDILSAADPTPIHPEDRVMAAYERLLEGYARWGGWQYHGWTDYPNVRNYQGPLVWSERDCGLRFAFELEPTIACLEQGVKFPGAFP